MPNDDQGWVTSTFTAEQLDGKGVYFALPTQNEKFFGHLHVESNPNDSRLRITIDYGGPDSSGQIQSGTLMIDQSMASALRPSDFVIIANM